MQLCRAIRGHQPQSKQLGPGEDKWQLGLSSRQDQRVQKWRWEVTLEETHIKDLLEQEGWETAEGRGWAKARVLGTHESRGSGLYPKIVDQALKELVSPSHYTLGGLSLCETAPEGPTREKSHSES